jgi:hypothetical protein
MGSSGIKNKLLVSHVAAWGAAAGRLSKPVELCDLCDFCDFCDFSMFLNFEALAYQRPNPMGGCGLKNKPLVSHMAAQEGRSRQDEEACGTLRFLRFLRLLRFYDVFAFWNICIPETQSQCATANKPLVFQVGVGGRHTTSPARAHVNEAVSFISRTEKMI